MFYNSHTVFPPFRCAFDANGFHPLQVFGCAALFDSHVGLIFRRFQPLLSHRCYPILLVFNSLLTAISVSVGCYATCSAPPLPTAAADRRSYFSWPLCISHRLLSVCSPMSEVKPTVCCDYVCACMAYYACWASQAGCGHSSCYLDPEEHLGFGVEFLVGVVAASVCQLFRPSSC